MKVIQSSNSSVTVKLSRSEVDYLLRAAGIALYTLSEQPVNYKSQPFLPKVQAVFNALRRIVSDKGWLDDEED
jgi:hypothetical protein